MEEAILARYGLLGLVVLALVRYGPKLLDRMTAWAVQHAENDDRTEEKITDAFIDELKRNGLEREATRQERIQAIAAQNNLAIAVHALREDIRQHTVFIRDFDARLSLYFRSRGETP